jgi:hypothetical protein
MPFFQPHMTDILERILNITSPHICHIFKIMALVKICTHDICYYLKYVVWSYSGMSAMTVVAGFPFGGA